MVNAGKQIRVKQITVKHITEKQITVKEVIIIIRFPCGECSKADKR